MKIELSFVVLVVACFNICETTIGILYQNQNITTRINSIDIVYCSPTRKRDVSIQNMPNNFQPFDARLPLKVLIHGWMGEKNHVSTNPIKNAYLSKGGMNLLSVDWSMGARQNYDLSRSFVPVAGKQIGQLLEMFFGRMNISLNQVHLLGHSLGAHIAGNVGKHFNGRINRITGLDPAGPLFTKNSKDAISKKNAQFVDSIHTDVGVLGELIPRAHVDFYPNRGFPPQPGCLTLDLLTASTCSHYRAPILYAETIMLPKQFLAAQCDRDSLSKSIKKCRPKYNLNGPRRLVYMGEHCPYDATGFYYVETNSNPPYGRGNYLA